MSKNNWVNAMVDLPEGHELNYVIKAKKTIQNKLSPFTPIATLNMKYSKNKNPDLIDLLGSLVPGNNAISIFIQLKNATDRISNIGFLDINILSESERVMFYRNMKKLKTMNMVKKVKNLPGLEIIESYRKGSYMINPDLIKPPKNIDICRKMWNLL